MTKEKPGCSFCAHQGHTWATPEAKRICFECLRSQRNEYHDLAARQAEEIAVLREQLRHPADNPALPPELPAGLRSDLLALHETTGQMLANLGPDKGQT